MTAATSAQPRDREAEILHAALTVLARDGIGGTSMRAVAREADVSLGLANYYFTDKTSLVCAALRRIGEQDLTIVEGDGSTEDPRERLLRALRRIGEPRFLERRYLALRLQLWSLASVDEADAAINRDAQRRYLRALTGLVRAAMPDLPAADAARRAGEILVVQNGVWLTAAIIDDRGAIERSIQRCQQIAVAPPAANHREEATA